VTVERPQDFAKAFEEAMASDLPAVIHVQSDPAALVPLPWVPT
jgi:acetolactate synthase-1/2/3 large subunit